MWPAQLSLGAWQQVHSSASMQAPTLARQPGARSLLKGGSAAQTRLAGGLFWAAGLSQIAASDADQDRRQLWKQFLHKTAVKTCTDSSNSSMHLTGSTCTAPLSRCSGCITG